MYKEAKWQGEKSEIIISSYIQKEMQVFVNSTFKNRKCMREKIIIQIKGTENIFTCEGKKGNKKKSLTRKDKIKVCIWQVQVFCKVYPKFDDNISSIII